MVREAAAEWYAFFSRSFPSVCWTLGWGMLVEFLAGVLVVFCSPDASGGAFDLSAFNTKRNVFCAFWDFTASRRTFYKPALIAFGLIGFAAHVCALNLSALCADCRLGCAFGYLAAANGAFSESTSGTCFLPRLAAIRIALDGAALNAKWNTVRGLDLGFGLLAAVAYKHDPKE